MINIKPSGTSTFQAKHFTRFKIMKQLSSVSGTSTKKSSRPIWLKRNVINLQNPVWFEMLLSNVITFRSVGLNLSWGHCCSSSLHYIALWLKASATKHSSSINLICICVIVLFYINSSGISSTGITILNQSYM